jgi:hypothetical protein
MDGECRDIATGGGLFLVLYLVVVSGSAALGVRAFLPGGFIEARSEGVVPRATFDPR